MEYFFIEFEAKLKNIYFIGTEKVVHHKRQDFLPQFILVQSEGQKCVNIWIFVSVTHKILNFAFVFKKIIQKKNRF